MAESADQLLDVESPSEHITMEELPTLLSTFQKLGIKPKTDSPKYFNAWAIDYVKSLGTTSLIEQKPVISSLEITQPPKIPFFAGDSSAKTESSFDTWLYEVECFQKNMEVFYRSDCNSC